MMRTMVDRQRFTLKGLRAPPSDGRARVDDLADSLSVWLTLWPLLRWQVHPTLVSHCDAPATAHIVVLHASGWVVLHAAGWLDLPTATGDDGRPAIWRMVLP
jgi:hypothetical protein